MRIAQGFLCILNCGLQHPSARTQKALLDKHSVARVLIKLLDSAFQVLRGKALLAVLLLARVNLRWLLLCCELKLVASVERLLRRTGLFCREFHSLFCSRRPSADAPHVVEPGFWANRPRCE